MSLAESRIDNSKTKNEENFILASIYASITAFPYWLIARPAWIKKNPKETAGGMVAAAGVLYAVSHLAGWFYDMKDIDTDRGWSPPDDWEPPVWPGPGKPPDWWPWEGAPTENTGDNDFGTYNESHSYDIFSGMDETEIFVTLVLFAVALAALFKAFQWWNNKENDATSTAAPKLFSNSNADDDLSVDTPGLVTDRTPRL